MYGFSSCSTIPGLKEVGSGGVFVLDSETKPLPEQPAAAGSSSHQATASKRPALEGETVGVINGLVLFLHAESVMNIIKTTSQCQVYVVLHLVCSCAFVSTVYCLLARQVYICM